MGNGHGGRWKENGKWKVESWKEKNMTLKRDINKETALGEFF